MAVPNIGANDFVGPVLGVAAVASALAACTGPGPTATGVTAFALAFVGLRIIWQDLADFTIPDAATLALGLIGLTVRIGEGADTGETPVTILGLTILDATLCGGAMLALREAYYRRHGHDGIGLGDVKLAAAGGVLLGTIGLSWAILGASLTGLAIVGVARIRSSIARTAPTTGRIAFGALLVPALWVAWFVAQTAPGVLERL